MTSEQTGQVSRLSLKIQVAAAQMSKEKAGIGDGQFGSERVGGGGKVEVGMGVSLFSMELKDQETNT